MVPDDLKEFIYSIFENRYIRLTPSDLERMVRQSPQACSAKKVRSAIKEMVAEGSLFYSNHFNTSHLELNFCRPVRVSPRIVLMPYGQTCADAGDGMKKITLLQGSAFGIGDHPTTRLSLRAVDNVMNLLVTEGMNSEIRALDIGTGSGVLAMAAVKLGADKVVAVDIDHMALYEACNNFRLNDMASAIVATDSPIDNLAPASFDLIMANLRPPTLKQILPRVEALSSELCHWIISGFRQEAMEEVARILPQGKTEILSRDVSCEWGALTLRYFHSKLQAEK